VPIYEYECGDCGKTFEVFLLSSDKPVKNCQFCQSENIKKLVSNCSFQLKGTGWYVTDYARKQGANNTAPGKKTENTKASETTDSTTSEKKETKKKDEGKAA